MSSEDKALHAEQQRVNLVVGLVRDRLAVLQAQTGELRSTIVDIRKNFWEDVTVNLEEPDDVIETYAAVKQQADLLSEKERAHKTAQHQMKLLTRLHDVPYFGRVDFQEVGEAGTEAIYVGVGSFRDAVDNFLVYDWRAPVSSVYYDYPPGPAEYSTPGGRITGHMTLKRQFVIQTARITSMFDTGVTIGDVLLQQMLGKQADPQMKSIVATIQREQNQIIRSEGRRVLIVQGAAGSGKTSAALQRIAYLLYRHRETLNANHILLFSPNPLFNSYISSVLPELGEENMQQTTFQTYLEHRLGNAFTVETVFEQLESMLQAEHDEMMASRMHAIRRKASPAYMTVIDDYIADLGRTGMCFRDVKLRGETLVTAAQIHDVFYGTDASWSIPNRLNKVVEWMTQELKRRARAMRDEPWVEAEIELLSKEDYLRAFQKLRRQQKFTEDSFNDFDQERTVLSATVVKRRFKQVFQRVKALRFVDMSRLYLQMLSNHACVSLTEREDDRRLHEHWDGLCEQTQSRMKQGTLPYEDATPYLYLKERIEGFQTNSSVRHVFIDEAQDYSAFQFAFLKRLFPQSRLTILGDPNQRIYIHGDEQGADFSPLQALYGSENVQTCRLRKSYRSTWEIVAFTRHLVAGGEDIEPFERHGDKPMLVAANSVSDLQQHVIDQIERLRADGHRTIAVICKTAEESQTAYDALRERLPARLIDQNTVSYESGILVIPSYLAKGVEFDAVIIYNGSNDQYGRAFERRLFYTACTRAMHALVINYVGDMSSFIVDVPAGTYDRW